MFEQTRRRLLLKETHYNADGQPGPWGMLSSQTSTSKSRPLMLLLAYKHVHIIVIILVT
jgi:hypothetical protein